jgi:hypothetical protein
VLLNYNKTLLEDNNKYVEQQINYLKAESNVFLAQPQQKGFEEGVFRYLREHTLYNFFNGREKPVILTPLISNGNTKALVLIAVRTHDNNKEDVEYVKFISAKFENNKWGFGVKDGHSYSFSYADKLFPRLDDKKIAEFTIRNLMLEGFFRNNLEDKSIFKSSKYVF